MGKGGEGEQATRIQVFYHGEHLTNLVPTQNFQSLDAKGPTSNTGMTPSMAAFTQGPVVPTLISNYNEKNNVHMKALRPRTFDPTTMKSTRRRIYNTTTSNNLPKNQSQERHFQQMLLQNFGGQQQQNASIFDS